MARLLRTETILKLEESTEITATVGLKNGLIALFFLRDYAVVNWQAGQIVAIGRNEEELSEVAPWRDLTVVAFNIAKSSIVVFELRKAQTLISFEFNFMQTECVNSLVSFGGNSVAVISLTASESTVQYFNSELRPVRKGLFSPLHVFDKLDEKTGVAAYCQSAKEGTIAIELVHSQLDKCKHVQIHNISEDGEPLLQRVWKLTEDQLLLGFNHRNKCFWEVHNIERRERVFRLERSDIIQDSLLLDTITSHSFSFLGMKKQVKEGRPLTIVYTCSYRTSEGVQNYVHDSGERTIADRRTVVFCKRLDKGQVRIEALRSISKDSCYLHLMKSLKALERYGSTIGSICTSLLSSEAEI